MMHLKIITIGDCVNYTQILLYKENRAYFGLKKVKKKINKIILSQ